MSIELKLASLAETAKRVRHTLESEEATKTALVLPFLMALDYNVFDPTEVVPEFRADVGVKPQERVDYALIRDGQPIILIEAKQANVPLSDRQHLTQLFRYWNATPVKIGILTNGIEYRFYGDTDNDNLMDAKPFLTVNITRMTPRDVASVSAFSKYNYNLEDTAKLSEELYYQDAIRKVMIEACEDPQTPFARWMMTRTYEGLKTASKVEWFKDQIRTALKDFCVANHKAGPRPLETADVSVEAPTSAQENSPKEFETAGSWTSLEDFHGVSGVKAPSAIRIENGEERGIKTWNGIIREVADHLISTGHLTANSCPVSASSRGSRYSISVEPRHANGKEFRVPHRLSNGLFMETNFSAKNSVRAVKHLLDHLGEDHSKVWLKTG